MELTVVCLTILCLFNMFKCKKAESRIRELETFVDDVKNIVADAAPADVTV